ncbi:hypothetical protein B0T16DRAFT_178879 [Cercophora newfieldiana]|uniref:Uncharacterized protein n=1 Tax=Cercophora newfieldiana TaxID=92897 RepID=A0AA39XZL7_9PEZI|nr:hypothetical protein B0T16DRAFT_178879 [Cercophora newfieldiana]
MPNLEFFNVSAIAHRLVGKVSKRWRYQLQVCKLWWGICWRLCTAASAATHNSYCPGSKTSGSPAGRTVYEDISVAVINCRRLQSLVAPPFASLAAFPVRFPLAACGETPDTHASTSDSLIGPNCRDDLSDYKAATTTPTTRHKAGQIWRSGLHCFAILAPN